MSDGLVKRIEAGKRGSGEAETFYIVVRRNNGRKGFTLIELLIAIAILSLIMSVVYKSFYASTDGIRRAEAADELNSMARAVFVRLMDDISGAYLSGKDVIFIGETRRDKGLPQDSLNLTSLTNELIVKDAKETELHEVGYYLKEDIDINKRGTAMEKAVFALYRRDKKVIGNEPPLEGGTDYLLTDEIAGLRFSYFDDDAKKWKDTWDSRTTNKLPKAVEVEVIIFDADKKERSFRTIIDVPMGNR